jgi:glutathione S-transferase
VIKFATEALFENFRIADDMLAGHEYFFDHFTAPDAHFFWCCRRATQLEVNISGFPNVAAHFKRMQERPSVKKLLAFEKEVQEGFAKTA